MLKRSNWSRGDARGPSSPLTNGATSAYRFRLVLSFYVIGGYRTGVSGHLLFCLRPRYVISESLIPGELALPATNPNPGSPSLPFTHGELLPLIIHLLHRQPQLRVPSVKGLERGTIQGPRWVGQGGGMHLGPGYNREMHFEKGGGSKLLRP